MAGSGIAVWPFGGGWPCQTDIGAASQHDLNAGLDSVRSDKDRAYVLAMHTRAVERCYRCPIMDECGSWAATHSLEGVYGGCVHFGVKSVTTPQGWASRNKRAHDLLDKIKADARLKAGTVVTCALPSCGRTFALVGGAWNRKYHPECSREGMRLKRAENKKARRAARAAKRQAEGSG